ncbi:RidA family protein [Pseudonocardia sp. T1-2H]|uniref:RidA family protein n=1 Tax=Pseudonocardia sp. T1-2H TaxID=3128899 RepID=UPI003100D610
MGEKFDLHTRLSELGLDLPPLRPKAGNYLGYVETGELLFLAGQGADGWIGRVGADLGLEQARTAARDCMLNLLAQADDALGGDWSRLVTAVKVLGFVACTEEFTQSPAVLDGASDLLVEVLGSRGRHGRSAIGVQSLPLGFAVEIEMILAVRPRPAGA